MNARHLAAAAAITVLSASVLAEEVPAPKTTAERLADMRQRHDRLAERVREWPAGPEREKAEQELELVDTAIESIKADMRSGPNLR